MTIPIANVETFANKLGLQQVIVFAYDGAEAHILTWGESAGLSAAAAEAANRIKVAMRWPEDTIVESPKVIALQKRVAELEAEVVALMNRSSNTEQVAPREVFCVELIDAYFGGKPDGYLVFLTKADALSCVEKNTPGPLDLAPDPDRLFYYVGPKPCSPTKYARLKHDSKSNSVGYLVSNLADLMKDVE